MPIFGYGTKNANDQCTINNHYSTINASPTLDSPKGKVLVNKIRKM